MHELRVKIIISMIKYWEDYESLYKPILGPIFIHIKNAAKIGNYSELYELAAFCNVLNINIQSIYPKITNYNFVDKV